MISFVRVSSSPPPAGLVGAAVPSGASRMKRHSSPKRFTFDVPSFSVSSFDHHHWNEIMIQDKLIDHCYNDKEGHNSNDYHYFSSPSSSCLFTGSHSSPRSQTGLGDFLASAQLTKSSSQRQQQQQSPSRSQDSNHCYNDRVICVNSSLVDTSIASNDAEDEDQVNNNNNDNNNSNTLSQRRRFALRPLTIPGGTSGKNEICFHDAVSYINDTYESLSCLKEPEVDLNDVSYEFIDEWMRRAAIGCQSPTNFASIMIEQQNQQKQHTQRDSQQHEYQDQRSPSNVHCHSNSSFFYGSQPSSAHESINTGTVSKKKWKDLL